MTSKKALRQKNAALSLLLSQTQAARRFAEDTRRAVDREKERIERQQAETNKVAEIRRGLIRASDLRDFVTDVRTSANRTEVTLRFEESNKNAVALALKESLTAKVPPWNGSIISAPSSVLGGHTSVIPRYNDDSWLTKREHEILYGGHATRPQVVALSPADRALLQDLVGKFDKPISVKHG